MTCIIRHANHIHNLAESAVSAIDHTGGKSYVLNVHGRPQKSMFL